MSTKKKPVRAFPQLPTTPRWAPPTPRANRALQQKSERRRKSANVNRPDSARNILRQLAKITAAQSKQRPSTPQAKPSTPAATENVHSPFISEGEEDWEREEVPQRPEFTLPIDEADEEENSELAPTRQELPGGEDYTFRSIDFAVKHSRPPTSLRSQRRRGSSRFPALSFPDEDGRSATEEDDITAQSIEYGRRAVSEGPAWDRYPRSSFGSIRMSEFGLEESRLGNEPDKEKSIIFDGCQADTGANMDEDLHLEDGETEDLQRTRISISVPADDGLFVPEIWLPNDENEANLGFGVDGLESDVAGAAASPESGDSLEPPANTESSGSSKQYSDAGLQSPDETTRQRTAIEAAALSRAPRRKKLKLTRNGNTVPALPSSLVKRVAIEAMTRIGKKKPTISRESLTALEQATEWFFEQMGEDLEAYSSHAKRRKRIDDTDVLTLMKRQRVLGRGRSLAELAEEFLPDDILLNLDLHDES